MIYFTSDSHFWHARIIEYTKRPFANVEEMNEEMIKRWNNVVAREDTVWHLGDFSLTNKSKTKEIFGRLNGYKNLIVGNHDAQRSDTWWRDVGFNYVWRFRQGREQYVPVKINYKNTEFYMDHNPENLKGYWFTDFYDDSIILFGHVHNKEKRWNSRKNIIHVGVDAWDYTPVSIETILEMAK